MTSGKASPFVGIRQEDDAGGEYWSARDLAGVLGYANWQNFAKVIKQAQTACENSGQAVSDHFIDVSKMVTLGSGARRAVRDWHLSRYACYLVVQNADPDKPIVALGQTYFAVQTRRAELGDELAGLSEAERRIYTREQLAEHNRKLADAARAAGVIAPHDFAIFQDHGYRGMYGGETARDIAARKGLRKGEKILDHMGSTELAANLFRATQAEDALRREGITDKTAANLKHYEVGAIVRRVIIEDLGGTPPEQLPTPPESIQQVRRRVEQERERERQPSLFSGPTDPEAEGE
jgi:DNA-damage-inducible protein D